jgi:hypothetical protein
MPLACFCLQPARLTRSSEASAFLAKSRIVDCRGAHCKIGTGKECLQNCHHLILTIHLARRLSSLL